MKTFASQPVMLEDADLDYVTGGLTVTNSAITNSVNNAFNVSNSINNSANSGNNSFNA